MRVLINEIFVRNLYRTKSKTKLVRGRKQQTRNCTKIDRKNPCGEKERERESVCVCEREKEKQKKGGRGRQRKRRKRKEEREREGGGKGESEEPDTRHNNKNDE